MMETLANWVTLDSFNNAKRLVPVVLLTFYWCWESRHPFRNQTHARGRHAVLNLGVALINMLAIAVLFGGGILAMAQWATERQFGVLNSLQVTTGVRVALALLMLDAWMYCWHRLNHVVPFLWWFHRMHHSDTAMDVTTATRFHLGELILSAVARLALIPLFGLSLWELAIYDTLVFVSVQFHHANISIGHLDRYVRWLFVTPDMHRVHHSDLIEETNSNYATVLSIWDRLARSFRMRDDTQTIVFGVDGMESPRWNQWWGMWATPFVSCIDDEVGDDGDEQTESNAEF